MARGGPSSTDQNTRRHQRPHTSSLELLAPLDPQCYGADERQEEQDARDTSEQDEGVCIGAAAQRAQEIPASDGSTAWCWHNPLPNSDPKRGQE